MRKLSKMLALGLAMFMTFGMTVSAAGSPVTGSSAATEALGQKVTGATANVEGVTVNANSAITEEAYKATDAEASKLKNENDIEDVKVLAAADVKVEGANGQEVTVTLDVADVQAGKTYVGIHLKDDGTTEILEGVVNADGKISFTSSNWSPILIVEVVKAEDEEEEQDEKDGVGTAVEAAATGANGAATSPKTGETLPIAGVMAVICMAGVAVCAKKVRD